MKNILKNSFWQLMVIYVLIIILIIFGIFSQYALQFNVLAVVIGLIGAFTLNRERDIKINKKLHYILLAIGLVLIFVLRIIPYLNNSIPLGYDPGLYKYGIEQGLENRDEWILQGGMEPGFLYFMEFFKLLFSTDFILKYLLIGFCVLSGLGVYFVSKEYFNKNTALIGVFIYAFSLIQFKTFWFMYYKNIVGMMIMLFSFYFLKKYEWNSGKRWKWLFILSAGLLGSIHRPTFYIFGLSYLIYAFVSPYSNKKYNLRELGNKVLSGVCILLIAGLFYIGDFSQAITQILPWVAMGFIDPGQGPGTFMNFFSYQYSILPYFALAILGLVFCLRKKIGILEIWALVNLSIVYFQFFFFNRFIIMLDLVLILFASYGFSLMIENKKKLGTILVIVLLVSLGFFAFRESINSKPLIDNSELKAIESLQNTEINAYVMSTLPDYSTWIQGYSGRKTIAPGLFDYNLHNQSQWSLFYSASKISEVKSFLGEYPKPLYIFIGKKQPNFLSNFSECLEETYNSDSNFVYEYIC